jgi:hypothetical protein
MKGCGALTNDQTQEMIDTRMRSTYQQSVDQFPDKVGDLLDRLDQVCSRVMQQQKR